MARYAFEYLFMPIAATSSFILYSLVFLRLRQNPDVKDGRTSARTYVATSGRDGDEMHLTTVAKQMLLHPIAYTVLVLPICFTTFYTSSGTSIPFPITVSTAAVFVLSGLVNVTLFCTTRRTLPGSWKQKFGIPTTSYSLPGDSSLSSRTVLRRQHTNTGRGISQKPASIPLSISVEKDVEIKHDGAESNTSSSSSSWITLSTKALPTHDAIQGGHTCGYYLQPPSFPPPLHIRLDGDDLDEIVKAGVHPEIKANGIA